MSLESRIKKLEKDAGQEGKVLIVDLGDFSGEAKLIPGLIPGELVPDRELYPDPEKEKERQRSEGKKVIVIRTPSGYEWSTKEKKWVKEEGHNHEP